MLEKHFSSPEDGERLVEQQSSINGARDGNLDKYDLSTEPERGTNERIRLVFRASDKALSVVNEFGHLIETIGTGEAAMKYIDEKIELERSQSRDYIERLQEIKSRIEREL